MLVLALGVHSVFEGIALGLQESAESAGKLAAGILLHKLAAAISLGGSFARTGFNLKIIIILLAIFSVTTPLGIIIGMSISGSDPVLDVIFQGLSVGTFVYVACSEIITMEFAKGDKQWIKMILVFLGGLVITVLWFFGDHEHGEECEAAHALHAGHDDH